MIPRGGWTIGWLGDIEIKINISIVFIALFVALSLALRILPFTAPGAGPVLYWLVGIVASVAFIGSILWHEMAHSLMALRYGIPVVQIILYLFGGVAQISREPERPVQEFWIAIVGPASSIVLAVAFGVLSRIGGVPGAACAWLAIVNLTLALFNLLPGFPLDGGRVLRSILWRIGGSFRLATRQASRVGQVMAGLFLLFALWQMLQGNLFNGIWFILIAGFLFGAATLSYRSARGASLAMDTPVQRVMRFDVPTIEPSMPLAILAWKYLDHYRHQAFPVVENGTLVGMISSMETNKIPREEWGKVKVAQTMLPLEKLCVVAPNDNIGAALDALEKTGMDHAPVYEADRFVGMLNRRDIVYRT
jgi:Zn-dependent protease/predicted transcriptional regulator